MPSARTDGTTNLDHDKPALLQGRSLFQNTAHSQREDYWPMLAAQLVPSRLGTSGGIADALEAQAA
jgi:hypothetical protein